MKYKTLLTLSVSLIVLALPGCKPSQAQSPSPPQKTALRCDNVRLLESRFHRNHVKYTAWDTQHLDRMVGLYMEAIDPSKTLLLESEFKKMRADVEESVARGSQRPVWRARKDLCP